MLGECFSKRSALLRDIIRLLVSLLSRLFRSLGSFRVSLNRLEHFSSRYPIVERIRTILQRIFISLPEYITYTIRNEMLILIKFVSSQRVDRSIVRSAEIQRFRSKHANARRARARRYTRVSREPLVSSSLFLRRRPRRLLTQNEE